jgi:hypothetical protein
MTNETIPQTNWLEEELATQTSHTEYEELPSLKLTPNVVTEITIDFAKPFEQWNGEQNGKMITKKIVPVSVNGTRMNWWLNVKNPIYRDVLQAGKAGSKTIKVLQTGSQANTKYVLVK